MILQEQEESLQDLINKIPVPSGQELKSEQEKTQSLQEKIDQIPVPSIQSIPTAPPEEKPSVIEKANNLFQTFSKLFPTYNPPVLKIPKKETTEEPIKTSIPQMPPAISSEESQARLAEAQKGVQEYLKQPGLIKQIYDLAQIFSREGSPEQLSLSSRLLINGVLSGLTLGNQKYIVNSAGKLAGIDNAYDKFQKKTKEDLAKGLGYQPGQALPLSEKGIDLATALVPYSLALGGARVATKGIQIPALRLLARGALGGTGIGLARKPGGEDTFVNRIKQIPPDVLFFTAIEGLNLTGNQLLKIYKWNKAYRGKTPVDLSAKDIQNLYRKMEQNLVGAGEPLTNTEKDIIETIKGEQGWRQAVREGWAETFPQKPTMSELFKAPVKPQVKPPIFPKAISEGKGGQFPLTEVTTVPAGYEITPEGLTYKPSTISEADLLKARYRSVETSPATSAIINVKPKADGSVDIHVQQPAAQPVPEPAKIPDIERRAVPREEQTLADLEQAERKFQDEIKWLQSAEFEPWYKEFSKEMIASGRTPNEPDFTRKALVYDSEERLDAVQEKIRKLTEAELPPEPKPSRTLPAHPMAEWVRKKGGIRYDSLAEAGIGEGELHHLFDHPAWMRRLIRKAPGKGMDICDLAVDAQQEGIIRTPEVYEFTEALEGDIFRNKPYPTEAMKGAYFEDEPGKAFMRSLRGEPSEREYYEGLYAEEQAKIDLEKEAPGEPDWLKTDDEALDKVFGEWVDDTNGIFLNETIKPKLEGILGEKLEPGSELEVEGQKYNYEVFVDEDGKSVQIRREPVSEPTQTKLKIQEEEIKKRLMPEAPAEQAGKPPAPKFGEKEPEEIGLDFEETEKFEFKEEKTKEPQIVSAKKTEYSPSRIAQVASNPGTKKIAEKAYDMVNELFSGTKIHTPKTIRKKFEEAGMSAPDELMQRIEQNFADRVASRAGGRVHEPTQKAIDAAKEKEEAGIPASIKRPLMQRLLDAGVREEIAENVKVMGRYPLKSIIDIKKSKKTGAQYAVVHKGTLKRVLEDFKHTARIEKISRKITLEYLGHKAKRTIMQLEVPQQYFKRIKLPWVYETIRVNERNAGNLYRRMLDKIDAITEGLTKAQRKKIGLYLMSKQPEYQDILKEAKVSPLKFSDLTKAEQKAVIRNRQFYKLYEPAIKKQARLLGYPIKKYPYYSPAYLQKDIVRIGGEGWHLDAPRKDPFFGSLMTRVEEPPKLEFYETDFKRNLESFAYGASRWLKMGQPTARLKALVESEEFESIVGKEITKDIKDWLYHVLSPKPANELEKLLLRLPRRITMAGFLGLPNPSVIAKQSISGVDAYMMEYMPLKIPNHIKQLVKFSEKGSAKERYPAIAIADLGSVRERALFYGITAADRLFAGDALSRMYAGELMKMEKEGIDLHDNKVLDLADRRIQNRLDLMMAGTTRSQFPPAWRTELGKLALQFLSTVNARNQYYIEKAILDGLESDGTFKNASQAKRKAAAKAASKAGLAMARALTAYIFSAYLEMVINKMDLTPKHFFKELGMTALGNIPAIGAIMFAIQYGKADVAPAIGGMGESFSRAMDAVKSGGGINESWIYFLEMAGFPKQFRKTYEGVQAVKKGVRVSANKIIEIDDPVDQFRAIVKGKYAPLVVREYYDDRELKSKWNKEIAEIIFKNAGKTRRQSFKDVKPSALKENIQSYIASLPPHARNRIKSIQQKAKANDIEISISSIASYLEKFWFEKEK